MQSSSDSPKVPLTSLHEVSPKWTRTKVIVAFAGSLVFLLFMLLRIFVALSDDGNVLTNVIGLERIQVNRSVGTEIKQMGAWEWPEAAILPDSFFASSLSWKVVMDVAAFSSLGVVIGILLNMSGLKEASRKTYVQHCFKAAIASSVLVLTFHWCGIDPVGLWQSRQNAWVHLAGRSFSDQELADIYEEAERSPQYFAEGEANYIITQNLKGLPAEEQPSFFEKQKMVKAEKAKILRTLDDEAKAEIVEEEYERLLEKKKGGYWPPETSPRRIWMYTTALFETIAIAIWASLLAVITAIPLSILAARNTLELMAPGEGRLHRWLRNFGVCFVRRWLDASRGFNELVLALVFVSVIGLGPFAGILALWIHTTGILGKVLSESIEAIDPGQVEALVGTGASSTQTISFSVMPQVMPTLISYSLLRFESNVRSAAILGWVGAGGIGFLLQDKMVGYSHHEVCTMMIMIIMAVSIIDYFCGKLRRRFI